MIHVIAAMVLVLSHSQFAMSAYYFLYIFLLISTMNLHISLSRSRNLSVHIIIGGKGTILITVPPEVSVDG